MTEVTDRQWVDAGFKLEAAEARVTELETALRTVRDWVRDGKGTEAEAAEAMDAALATDRAAREETP